MGNIGSSSSTKIREFSISGQKLKLDDASDVSEYVKLLNKAKGLEVVNLSGNTLGLEACKAIAAALEGHLTLQEVNLSDCFTGRLKEDVPPAIEAFGKVLADKPALKVIDFSDNAFSPAGATALSFFLANCTSLEELRLNNNGLGPEGGKIIANGLKENRRKSQALGKASVLRRVTIGRNRLENGSAVELAEAFSLHENLEDVALFQNGIRPEGIVALSQGLSKCLKLKSLDLQDNTFTSKGSKALASAIPSWSELARLNVGDCLLSDDGCKEIISNLVSGPAASKMTILNLQYAEMESETAQFLASNLGAFTSLERLFLNGNCFAPAGVEVEKIKSALLPTTTLDELEDMDFEESDVEDSEEESEEKEVKFDEQIVSTPSPKVAVDEVADVTEIIGTMAIKEAPEVTEESADVTDEDVTMTDAVECTEATKEECAVEDTIESVTNATEATAEVVTNATQATNDAVIEAVEAVTEVTNDATEATAEAVNNATEATSEAFTNAFQVTNDAVTEATEAASETAEAATEKAQEAFANAEEFTADTHKTADETVNNVIDTTNEFIAQSSTAATEVIAQATEKAGEAKEAISQAVDSVTETVQTAVGSAVEPEAKNE